MCLDYEDEVLTFSIEVGERLQAMPIKNSLRFREILANLLCCSAMATGPPQPEAAVVASDSLLADDPSTALAAPEVTAAPDFSLFGGAVVCT